MLLPRYRKPRVYENLITHEECEYIKQVATPHMKPSTIGDSRNIDNQIRKSDTAWVPIEEDEQIKSIVERCLKYTKKSIDHCEYMQVVRYKESGFYKMHQDANRQHENKRIHTFIIALNEDYEGGETHFPILNKKYKLKEGDVLFFDTIDNYGRVPNKALHGGEPVTSGEKWICNLWVRQNPYDG